MLDASIKTIKNLVNWNSLKKIYRALKKYLITFLIFLLLDKIRVILTINLFERYYVHRGCVDVYNTLYNAYNNSRIYTSSENVVKSLQIDSYFMSVYHNISAVASGIFVLEIRRGALFNAGFHITLITIHQ